MQNSLSGNRIKWKIIFLSIIIDCAFAIIYLSSLKIADFRAVFFCLLRDATLARLAPRLASFSRQIRDALSDRSLAYSLASQLALFSYLV